MIAAQPSSETRVPCGNDASLLGRLKADPADPDAWSKFFDLYGPRIRYWCRTWGLREPDAEDVLQDVLLNLTTRIGRFCYDANRNFRGWLKTVARHQSQRNAVHHRKAVMAWGGDSFDRRLETVAAGNEASRQPDDAFDLELLQKAAVRVRRRVGRRTWNAFRLTALRGYSGAETAGRLGMEVGTVFVSRSRIQRMLRDEVARMRGTGTF